jgi:hypothetical protein
MGSARQKVKPRWEAANEPGSESVSIGNRQSQIRSILFKNKDEQFRTGAQGSTVGRPNV